LVGKIILTLVFSVLLLVPVGAQQVFATHPDLPCPPPGVLNTDPFLVSINLGTSNFCYAELVSNFILDPCSVGYSFDLFEGQIGLTLIICTALPQQTPDPALAAQCQNNAVLVGNHCEPDLAVICSTGTIVSGLQCIAIGVGQMIGGTLLEIDKFALIVAAIGIDPLITGLVALTIVGVAGQAAWIVHKKKRN